MFTPIADVRNLIHELGRTRELPWIVTDKIASMLDQQDLLVLSRVGRHIRSHALPFIYENVDLDFDNPDTGITAATLLLRTLVRDKSVALQIRRFVLSGELLWEWRESLAGYDSDPDLAEGYQTNAVPLDMYLHSQEEFARPEFDVPTSSWNSTDFKLAEEQGLLAGSRSEGSCELYSLLSVCIDIIRSLPALQELRVASDFFRYTSFRDSLTEIIASEHLQKLRSCSLCADIVDCKQIDLPRDMRTAYDWTESLYSPFFSAGVNSVETVLTNPAKLIDTLRMTTITHLSLYHYESGTTGISNLLSFMPDLQVLRYDVTVEITLFKPKDSSEPKPRPYLGGLNLLFESLQYVNPNLKELYLSERPKYSGARTNQHFEGCLLEQPHHHLRILSSLRQLRTLQLPYHVLLGCASPETTEYHWPDILPASIQKVALTDETLTRLPIYHWTNDERYLSAMRDMIRWISSRTNEVGRCKFELLLTYIGFDFHLPVREDLAKLCSDLGMDCSVVKKNKDHYRRRFWIEPDGKVCFHRTRIDFSTLDPPTP